MEITPATSSAPVGLKFAACPPPAVACGWLMMVTAPDGLNSLDQVVWGLAIAFFASLASLPALIISISAVRAAEGHRRLTTFALVGNALVTLQTAGILLSTTAYAVFWR